MLVCVSVCVHVYVCLRAKCDMNVRHEYMCVCICTAKKTSYCAFSSDRFWGELVCCIVCICVMYVYFMFHMINLYICNLSWYTGGNLSPSTQRGFKHLTASCLILPSHQHRQALRRMRHPHWHSLVKSRVPRHRIRQLPNLWTSYCFTTNPYFNSTSACRDSLVTTPQTSLLTALGRSELPKHEIRLLQYMYMCLYI